jgi:hypothetical protein
MPRRPPIDKVKRDNMIHVPGSYEAALRESCRREMMNPTAWLEASGDAASFAAYERDTAVLADLLCDERAGEPVIAWWYWLPTPLPPQLRTVGRAADAPRQFRVIPGDLVEPMTR